MQHLPVSMTDSESSEFTFPSVTRGFHGYQRIWQLHTGVRLKAEKDYGNQEDRFAMAIFIQSVDNNNTTFGHLPREFRKKLVTRATLQQEKIKLSRTCPFSQLECLFQTAEPAHKRTETIFSAQCEVWCNQKYTIGFNGYAWVSSCSENRRLLEWHNQTFVPLMMLKLKLWKHTIVRY